MSDTLSRILEYKAEEVAARKPLNPIASLEGRASAQEAPRGFEAALRACPPDRYALIAEVKKASPSKGLIREDFDPPILARAYADGGASCLSVLTDAPSFQGDDAYVAAARAACPLPVLRKEFLVDVWQVAESRALGADAILVIMAAVDDALAADLVAAARHYGMDALVECHDEAETERALRLPVGMIGINNRNLKTFEVSLETTERLSRLVPTDRLLVAESGIFTNSDCARLAASRAGAFLVGESLMRKADVTAATRELIAR